MAGWSREEAHDDRDEEFFPHTSNSDADVDYPMPRHAVAFNRRRRTHDGGCGRGPSMDENRSETQTQSGPSSNTDWPGRRAAEPRPPKIGPE